LNNKTFEAFDYEFYSSALLLMSSAQTVLELDDIKSLGSAALDVSVVLIPSNEYRTFIQ
jgi:hypothetical protein